MEYQRLTSARLDKLEVGTVILIRDAYGKKDTSSFGDAPTTVLLDKYGNKRIKDRVGDYFTSAPMKGDSTEHMVENNQFFLDHSVWSRYFTFTVVESSPTAFVRHDNPVVLLQFPNGGWTIQTHTHREVIPTDHGAYSNSNDMLAGLLALLIGGSNDTEAF